MEKEHFEVLLEEIRDHIQLLGEGQAGLLERLERTRTELKEEIRERYELLAGSLVTQRERVDHLEVELKGEIRSVGAKVEGLDGRVEALEAKVDRLARGQREMKKLLSSSLEVQADHGMRLDRLEQTVADHLEDHT